MEIKFQKSSNRSYMIIDTDAPFGGMDDEQELLRTTRVDNLLKFYTIELDEDTYQIWYDITKLKSVNELLTNDCLREIGITSADALLQRVRAALEDISSKYLINSASVYITVDTVYFDAAGNIYFTYFPAESANSAELMKQFRDDIGVMDTTSTAADSLRYQLTAKGREIIRFYEAEAYAKRKEILDACKDTADDTFIPNEDDVINDLNNGYVEENGSYQWLWSVTDGYSMDYPLELILGEDFVDTLAKKDTPTKSLADALADMQHAFYTMLSVAEDNLPDGDDDEYVDECNENFNSARDEFEEAYEQAVKLTA